MKIIYPLAIAGAAFVASMTGAQADSAGGTTRPSYDNPRDYGRDAAGNETYRRTTPGNHSRQRGNHRNND